MGKLTIRLEKQLKTEFKKDAEDCIEIYDKLKDMANGKVWNSQWTPLVNVDFIGDYPYERRFKPTAMGYVFLKGKRN